MAYNKGKQFNHFGQLRFFNNHIALQESIQPVGNFYLLDKQVALDLDSEISDNADKKYGDYMGKGISSISEQNQKVRDIFTNCSPSVGQTFILPSSHGCFEWNILCTENNSPNIHMDERGVNAYNPWSTHLSQQYIDTCFIWFHFTDASGQYTYDNTSEDAPPISWYIEFVYSDNDTSSRYPTDNVETRVAWESNGDDLGSSRIDCFLGGGQIYNKTINESGDVVATIANPYHFYSNTLGFSWTYPDDQYKSHDNVVKVRLCYIMDDSYNASNTKVVVNNIWLGKKMHLPIAPDVNVGHEVKHDGIKSKKTISGKEFTNVEYFSSPNNDIFHNWGPKVETNYRWSNTLQNTIAYATKANQGRKSWDFSISNCPAQFLFSGNDTRNHAGLNYAADYETPEFTPDGWHWSSSVGGEGNNNSDTLNERHLNLSSIVRLTGNGILPFIFCQDWENRVDSSAEISDTYWNSGDINPSLFHIVRFTDFPSYERVTNQFWNTEFSLEESW